MENFNAVGKLGVVTNNNGRLVTVGNRDRKFRCSSKVLGDLSQDMEFRHSEKVSTTGGNSKEERLVAVNNELQQNLNND